MDGEENYTYLHVIAHVAGIVLIAALFENEAAEQGHCLVHCDQKE
jgi:hypothetical protein